MKKITLMDGAVGTSLWELAEQRGIEKVPVWRYSLEQPDMVEELNRRFVAAGSEIILSNTFGANRPAVKRASSYEVPDLVRAGVEIAKKAAAGTNVRVALGVGPLSTLLEPYGDTTEEEAEEIYDEMIGTGVAAGADLVYLQTFMDLEMIRVGAEVARRYQIPVFCTMTFEKRGKTMMGNSVEDMIETLAPLGVEAVGLNCSLGPDLAQPIIREFAEKTQLPIILKPNAGKPILAADGSVEVHYSPEIFLRDLEPVLGLVQYVGGCCGCNADYVRALKQRLER